MSLPATDTDWSALYRRLIAFALAGLRRRNLPATITEAEDVVQQALLHAYSPDHKSWSPDEGSLADFLGSTINGILQNRRRHSSSREEKLPDLERGNHLDSEQVGRSREDAVHAILDASALVGQLLDRLSDDPAAVDVVLTISEGIEKPQEVADKLGVRVEDVYNARKRINRHVTMLRSQVEKGKL